MAIAADILRAMRAAGATAEAIIAAVEADQAIEAAKVAERRAKAAAKKRRQRAEVELRSFDVPGTFEDIEGHEGTCGDGEGQTGTAGDKIAVVGKEGPQTPKETTPEEDTPSDPKGSSAPKGTDRRRGSRIPDDFEGSAEAKAITAAFGLAGQAADEALAEFCDYWRALPGLKATKLDWPATFRNRLREVARRRPPPGRPPPGQRLSGLTALAHDKAAARQMERNRELTLDLEPRPFPTAQRGDPAHAGGSPSEARRDERWPDRDGTGTVHDFPARRAFGG